LNFIRNPNLILHGFHGTPFFKHVLASFPSSIANMFCCALRPPKHIYQTNLGDFFSGQLKVGGKIQPCERKLVKGVYIYIYMAYISQTFATHILLNKNEYSEFTFLDGFLCN